MSILLCEIQNLYLIGRNVYLESRLLFVLDDKKSEISDGLFSDCASIDKGVDILKNNTITKTDEQVTEILRQTKPRAGVMIQKETSQVGKVRVDIIFT